MYAFKTECSGRQKRMETDSVSEMWRAMLGNTAFPEYCTVWSDSDVYDVHFEERDAGKCSSQY